MNGNMLPHPLCRGRRMGFALQAALDGIAGFMLPGTAALLVVLIPGLLLPEE